MPGNYKMAQHLPTEYRENARYVRMSTRMCVVTQLLTTGAKARTY